MHRFLYSWVPPLPSHSVYRDFYNTPKIDILHLSDCREGGGGVLHHKHSNMMTPLTTDFGTYFF